MILVTCTAAFIFVMFFLGFDTPTGHVTSLYWSADWLALSENWKRCQQGF